MRWYEQRRLSLTLRIAVWVSIVFWAGAGSPSYGFSPTTITTHAWPGEVGSKGLPSGRLGFEWNKFSIKPGAADAAIPFSFRTFTNVSAKRFPCSFLVTYTATTPLAGPTWNSAAPWLTCTPNTAAIFCAKSKLYTVAGTAPTDGFLCNGISGTTSFCNCAIRVGDISRGALYLSSASSASFARAFASAKETSIAWLRISAFSSLIPSDQNWMTENITVAAVAKAAIPPNQIIPFHERLYHQSAYSGEGNHDIEKRTYLLGVFLWLVGGVITVTPIAAIILWLLLRSRK